MWHTWEKGMRGKMFRVLAAMCASPSSIVSHDGCLSPPFTPGMGWEQGDTLATTMFNIHVDCVLRDVWAHHDGVPLPPPPHTTPAAAPHPPPDRAPFNNLVALMYADDVLGLATTPAALQALITTVRTTLTRWRIKASVSSNADSKTAAMAIAAPVPQASDSLTWGATTLPWVDSYKYLGVHIATDALFDVHIADRLQKGIRAARALHGVTHNRALPLHLRLLALTGAILPTATWGVEIWHRTTATHRKTLDSWQMGIVKSMLHCPPKATHACICEEVGLLPMHKTCDQRMLGYWHRLQRAPPSSLLRCVACAWSSRQDTWLKAATTLLSQYDIDPAAGRLMLKAKFLDHVKDQVAARVRADRDEPADRKIVTAYRAHFAAEAAPTTYRQYFSILRDRARAAELIIQLRILALPLRWLTSKYQGKRQRNSTPTFESQCGPCCHAPVETPCHFLFDCLAY